MEYYVYILASATNTVVYTGVTNNLIRRVYEHKQRIHPESFTYRYHVDRLVYYESHASIITAIEREKQIKSWNRKRKDQIISGFNPHWLDLYDSLSQ